MERLSTPPQYDFPETCPSNPYKKQNTNNRNSFHSPPQKNTPSHHSHVDYLPFSVQPLQFNKQKEIHIYIEVIQLRSLSTQRWTRNTSDIPTTSQMPPQSIESSPPPPHPYPHTSLPPHGSHPPFYLAHRLEPPSSLSTFDFLLR